MRFRQIAWLAVVPIALLLSSRAPAAGEEKKADELLQSKGLHQSGQYFVLADETVLKKKFHELDPLHRKVTESQRKAAKAEKVIEQKKQLIIQTFQQRRQLRLQLASVNNITQHNRMVDAINELTDRLVMLETPGKEEKDAKTFRAAATEVSQHYVELIIQIRKQYKEIKAKYDALAADADVKKAVDEANKAASTSCKLGPGTDMLTVDKSLKKLESSVLSETIQMRREDGDTWSVPVTFNGQHSRDLMIDTGASSIILPYQMATEVGMTPSPNDPTFTAILADGHTVECKLVYAQKVRVGMFTVEHVECGIMPEKCTDAAAVLGQSFLKGFTFRIDNLNGKLVMSQIGAQKKRTGKQAEAGKTEEAEDKTEIPKTAEGDKNPTEQLIKLLKLDNERPSDRFDTTDPNGDPVQLLRSKWETVDNLRKVAGDPDEVYKIPMKSKDPAEKAAPPWKMYTWGPVSVMVDDTGHARFYCVVKEKEKEKGK